MYNSPASKRTIAEALSGYFFHTGVLISLMFIYVAHTNANATEEMDADSIVERSNLAAYYGGDDGRTMARMKIIDANGRQQIRQFAILRKDVNDGGEQKFYVIFSRPSDVKDTVFMVHKKNTTDDDRWLYLPALDLVKRISAGDKRTSFVGAHYFYEDVSGRSINEDSHSLIESNKNYYLLKHEPKNPESVEFSHYKTWIDPQTFLPQKIEYYDAKDNAYRLIETLSTEKVQGIPTVTKAKVTDLTDQSYTLLEFRNMSYNIGLPDEVFTERALRSPPIQWLTAK